MIEHNSHCWQAICDECKSRLTTYNGDSHFHNREVMNLRVSVSGWEQSALGVITCKDCLEKSSAA